MRAGHVKNLGMRSTPLQGARSSRRALALLVVLAVAGCDREPEREIVTEVAALTPVAKVRVFFTITTVDPMLWRRVEPGTPHPRRRLEAVRQLNAAMRERRLVPDAAPREVWPPLARGGQLALPLL